VTAATTPLVALDGVWRRYRLASPKRPRTLRASIVQDPRRRHRDSWFWALKGVHLEVHRGEAVGLLGRNGAGKSTLLRLIGGVGRPDRGTLRVDGRIGALVDLGHELHGDLTGRQNAELAGVIAGLSRREVRDRFDAIIDFAELAEFVDEPLRAYSDGMRARLAFSVMAHLDPDVLLVDEALSVGDAAFQRRALDHIRHLRDEGVGIVLVSHDLALLRRLCDRAVWLEQGEVAAAGRPQDVVAAYLDRASGSGEARPHGRPERGCLTVVRLLDEWGAPTAEIATGAGLVLAIDVDPPPGDQRALLQVRIVRADTETVVVDTSTPLDVDARRQLQVAFERLDLAPGEHLVEVAVYAAGWTALVDQIEPLTLEVRGAGPDTALLDPPHRWSRAPRPVEPRPEKPATTRAP
jgi:lipopolysaccharide transport system ATP-binding protein